MSTNLRNFVLFGVKLDYKEAKASFSQERWDNLYKDMWDKKMNPKDVFILEDNMDGSYFYVGIAVAVSEDYQSGMPHFDTPVEIIVEDWVGNGEYHLDDPGNSDLPLGKIYDVMEEKWPELVALLKSKTRHGFLDDNDLRFHVVSHYS